MAETDIGERRSPSGDKSLASRTANSDLVNETFQSNLYVYTTGSNEVGAGQDMRKIYNLVTHLHTV